MITIEHLHKTFTLANRTIPAVQDVSIHIRQGEIFGIMGTSGAGKSTLVRCLNFLEVPDQGAVEIDGFGKAVARHGNLYFQTEKGLVPLKEKRLRNLRSQIGMIFQHFNLLDRRTVADNIAYPLKYKGLNLKEVEAKVERLLELVHLEDKKYAYPAQLSGGQKQRVAIARALASDPKILLCDEATSALDPQATTAILSLLKELNRQLQLTIVLITHEMDVIKKIADRAAVMENGKVVEEGTVYDLFLHPEHPLTKEFVYASSGPQTKEGLPSELSRTLDEHSREGLLVRLNFDDHSLRQPVLFEMIRSLAVEVNILKADIDRIGGQPYGSLLIQVKGTEDEFEQLKDFLKKREVALEVIANA